MFEHENVVNWWPEPSVLQSVMYNFNLGALYNDYTGGVNNPKFGGGLLDRAPVQQAMNQIDKGLDKIEKMEQKLENAANKAGAMVDGLMAGSIPGVGGDKKAKKSKSTAKGKKDSEAEPLTVGRREE